MLQDVVLLLYQVFGVTGCGFCVVSGVWCYRVWFCCSIRCLVLRRSCVYCLWCGCRVSLLLFQDIGLLFVCVFEGGWRGDVFVVFCYGFMLF